MGASGFANGLALGLAVLVLVVLLVLVLNGAFAGQDGGWNINIRFGS